MTKVLTGAFAAVGAFGGLLALDLLLAAWRAWAAAKIWNWFAVPLMEWRPLTIAEALATIIVIGIFSGNLSAKDDDISTVLARRIIYPPIVVAFAWIIKEWFL